MRQSFTRNLFQVNSLDGHGFHSWLLRPGMRFGDDVTWWGPGAARPTPHEGIDLYSYIDTAGHCRCLPPGTKIPPLARGTVVDIFPDFLGHSLLIAHEQVQEGWRFHSILAHIDVAHGVVRGRRYDDGVALARLSASSRSGVPAHLHLSTVTILGSPPQPISWSAIVHSDTIRMVDPVPYIDGFDHNTPGLSL